MEDEVVYSVYCMYMWPLLLLTDLMPGVRYKIYVSAENGVSSMADISESRFVEALNQFPSNTILVIIVVVGLVLITLLVILLSLGIFL